MKLSFTKRTWFWDGRSGARCYAYWYEMPLGHPGGQVSEQFDGCDWRLREEVSVGQIC